METFSFFCLRFRRSFDSANDSDFLFSLGHKRSYDSAYDSAYDSDSDSVASENQPLASGASFLGIEELRHKGSNTGKRRTEQNVTLICYCFLKKCSDINPLKSVVI